MNKNAIQRFAIWARTELISQVSQRAYQYDITADGYGEYEAEAVGGRLLTDDEKKQRQGLIDQIRHKGYVQVMEEVAYTWFNRFIALRYMEVNNYLPTHIRVFSDASGAFKPKILTSALHLDLPGLDIEKVSDLIEKNQSEDLYRYLLLTQCNALSVSLPRMFEDMGSYTELLLPNNILRQDGVLGRMVTDIPEEDWTDQVQIIGWLYQYYNTELKDDTFALLKKNVKITKERIPSATQLFTPDWIVRYMVENSLGRLWIEGHPDDELKAGWKYYLDEAEQEADVQAQLEAIRAEYRTLRPQDIKVIDPCMGSGHILVYAFDVLVQIYKRAGFSERDAAQNILENNLYGLDIDERATQLAYFSVIMKARQYDRRILTRKIQPNIYSTTSFSEGQEFGSLYLVDCLEEAPKEEAQMSLFFEQEKNTWNVKRLLSQKYDVVVTNPPYMGAGGMEASLAEYIKSHFPDAKTDLFSCFIERAFALTKPHGFVSMITMESWMFLSSFEKMRSKIISGKTIFNMVHMPYLGRGGTSLGINFGTAAFIIGNRKVKNYNAQYDYIRYFETDDEGVPTSFPVVNERYCTAQQDNFSDIPGSPIAYWVSDILLRAFQTGDRLKKDGDTRQGMATSDNNRFLRYWQEVDFRKIGFGYSSPMLAQDSKKKWFPYNKGGAYRKWYGNQEYVINYENDGLEVKGYATSLYKSASRTIKSMSEYFKPCISWSKVTTVEIAFRYFPAGFIFDVAGCCIFYKDDDLMKYHFGFLNSAVCASILKMVSPTMNYEAGHIASMPVIVSGQKESIIKLVNDSVDCSKSDWDSYETSWDFEIHPIVKKALSRFHWGHEGAITIEYVYKYVAQDFEERFKKLKTNEEELNRIFIDIYGLQNELKPEVEDKDVTVRRAELGRDIRSMISYAVGCMFGRYSLVQWGLAFAGGEWNPGGRGYADYGEFEPDKDNIIPICDDEYFDDDITGRFIKWVEVVFGKETLEENLKYIADALGGKGTPREVIRNYFLNGFYADHLKTYQKRPIYWLFDSGKKNGFKALIYMHRYQSDLLARMRTDYVHEQQERYRTQLKHIGDAMDSVSASERVKLAKQQKKFQEQALELQKYEEKVHHLADQNIKIDLDDGVKVNYAKFEEVLAKIK